MTATRAKEIPKFAVLAAGAVGGVVVLEAAHTSDPPLDATMALFKAVVQGGTGPVPSGLLVACGDRAPFFQPDP